MIFYADSLVLCLNIIDLYLLSSLSLLLKTYHFELFLKGGEAAVRFLSKRFLKRLHTEDSENMISGIVLIDGVLAQQIEQGDKLHGW